MVYTIPGEDGFLKDWAVGFPPALKWERQQRRRLPSLVGLLAAPEANLPSIPAGDENRAGEI